MFIGRNTELTSLQNAIAQANGKANIILLTGRRRVGKSRLIEEFALKQKKLQFNKIIGIPPKKQNRAKTELNALAAQYQQTFNVVRPQLNDWHDAMHAMATYLKDGNCIFMIDEINWFGKTHEDMPGALFGLWESELKHIKGLTLVLTGSLAGWIQKHLLENTGYYGRISWHHTLKPLPLSDSLRFIPPPLTKRMSKHEQMSFMLVSGGIPFYLEQYNFKQSFKANIQRLAFTSSGYFFTEFDTLMADLFKSKAERIEDILLFLNERSKSAPEIAKHLGQPKPNGYLYETLSMLCDMEFIAATYDWDVSNGTRAKRDPAYYICDPYLRFYLKAILPQKGNIIKGFGKPPSNIDSLLGFQFEHLMRRNIDIIFDAINVNSDDVLYFDRFFAKGYEIDLLIETKRSFYIVEMKYYVGEVPQTVSKELKQKLDRFGTPQNKSVKSVVLHVNGANNGLINSDYVDTCAGLFETINKRK